MAILNYFLNVSLVNFNIMKALFKEGWAANRVQTWMSENATGYRRSTVQAVKREVLNMVKYEYAWKHVAGNKIPNKRIFSEREYRAPYTYWIHYNTDMLNELTGKTETKQLSHFADTLKSPEDWGDEILASLNPDNYRNIMAFSNLQITGVDHAAGMKY